MSSIYVKANKIYARYKDESGKWTAEATPFRPGQEVKARQFVKQLESRAKATRELTDSIDLAPGTARRRGCDGNSTTRSRSRLEP